MMPVATNGAMLHAQHARRAASRLVFRPAQRAGALACWIALPERSHPSARPLVAMHGIRRAAQEQAALFAARANALGRPVIAPLFDAEHWPAYQRLAGAQRADLALLELLQRLQAEDVARADRFDLFGFSAGAQFAHRFAMLHPHRIGQLSVASAGWYTFPDSSAYPYGLGARSARADWGPRMRAELDAFLRLPIRVCVGAKDNVRDPNTRGGAAIDRQQGRDRRTRAARWVEALEIEAAVRGIVPRVKLSVLPDCGHDFRGCVRRGGLAKLVLPDPADDAPWPLLSLSYPGTAVSRRAVVASLIASGF